MFQIYIDFSEKQKKQNSMKKLLIITMLVCLWVTTHANTSFSSLKDHESILVCDTLFIKKLLVSDTITLDNQLFTVEVNDIAHYAYVLKGSYYDLYIQHNPKGYVALKIDHIPLSSQEQSLSFKEYIQKYPYCFGFFLLLIMLCIGIYLVIPCRKQS